MTILLLSNNARLVPFLERYGHVILTDKPIFKGEDDGIDPCELTQIDYIISYGYRHIIPAGICDTFKGRILNLHISYLPWNRGADPNLWSYLEDTPKGVTIHEVDKGLDTGNIIYQEKMKERYGDTLETTYNRLTWMIETAIEMVFPLYEKGWIIPAPQKGNGSYHRSSDKERFEHLLSDGWQTEVKEIRGKGKENEGTYKNY
jgi:methionyl-tRNA formyltransferase